MSWNAARRAAAVALFAAFAPPASGAPGVPWETRFTMEMDGMAMPAQTKRVCVPEGRAPQPPAGPDGSCRVADAKRSGNRMRWKVVCEGDRPMTGEGDMTFSADAWKGNLTLRSGDGPMKVAMRGRRLGGRCDADDGAANGEAARRQAEDAARLSRAAATQLEAASCDGAVDSMNVSMLTGKDALCKDPRALQRLCARLETRGGFSRIVQHPEESRRRAFAACKRGLASVRRRLCKSSLDDAPAKDAVDFLGKHCPDEVARLGKRECAGRDFTGLDPQWASFCSQHASHLMAKEAAQKEAKETAKDEAVNAGKKALRGLLGF